MAETWPKKPLNGIITLDRHAGLFLMFIPPVPPILPGFAWHLGVSMEMASASFLGTDKWNYTVLVDGMPICSRGNDPGGSLSPHWNLFPAPGIFPNPNLFMPFLALLSSSKSFMAIGSVIGPKGPIAVTIPGIKCVGINLACNDPVPLPTDIVLHTGSTVILGFTWGDLVAALLTWAYEVLVAVVIKVLGKLWTGIKKFAIGNKGPPGLLKRQTLNALDKLGLPKIFNQPRNVVGEHAIDRFLSSSTPKAGQFQSVADQIVKKETSLGVRVGKSLFGELFGLENKTWHESLPEKIGRYVDNRSEPVPSESQL